MLFTMRHAGRPKARTGTGHVAGRALATLVALISIVVIPVAPQARAVHNFVTYPDVGGIDDSPNQSDLVETSVDYSHLDDPLRAFWVSWSWDETGFNGANTGDACALFDSDLDGFVNYAICVSVGGNPAVQQAGSPQLFQCPGDNLANRCNPASPISLGSSTCSVDPILPGDTDTVATCEVIMDDIGGGPGTSYVNTCSFTSIVPNSAARDCILDVGMGINVVKDVSDDASVASGFTVDRGWRRNHHQVDDG